MNVILDFRTITAYRKTAMGSQIIVGLIKKTNAEKAKRSMAFLFVFNISLRRIRDKTITGKSGLGD
ncbi:hypothetical protein LDL59_03280 [Kaistella anthropi]|nr:hypothetical protein [Kaistella anthropi]